MNISILLLFVISQVSEIQNYVFIKLVMLEMFKTQDTRWKPNVFRYHLVPCLIFYKFKYKTCETMPVVILVTRW